MPANEQRLAKKEQRRAAALAQRAADRMVLGAISTRLNIASAIAALASLCAVIPFVLIAEVARELLLLDANWSRVWFLLLLALCMLGLRGLLQSGAMLWSHLIDAEHQYTLRQMLAAKLSRVPLGWFDSRSSGEIKKLLQNDVEALHYLVAHARLEFVSALTLPIATFVYLAWIDWRLALVLLLPIVVYAFVMSKIMGPG